MSRPKWIDGFIEACQYFVFEENRHSISWLSQLFADCYEMMREDCGTYYPRWRHKYEYQIRQAIKRGELPPLAD